MTKQDDRELLKKSEDFSKEVEGALNMMLEDEIKASWAGNTIAWVATVAGAFVLNLVLLVLIAGGS